VLPLEEKALWPKELTLYQEWEENEIDNACRSLGTW
jgi:hypothetical protein